MLAFLIKASVAALKKFPTSTPASTATSSSCKQYFHIGFAADTPNGLVVPVIKDADQKGVLQISHEMGELAKKARDGKLTPGRHERRVLLDLVARRHRRRATSRRSSTRPRSRSSASAAARPSRVWDGKAFQPRLILPLSLELGPPRRRRRGGGALQRLPDPGARRLPAGVAVTVDVRVPDIGDFQDVDGHRGPRQAGRHRRRRAEPDHGRERQGVDGDSVVAGRRGEGARRSRSATRSTKGR